MSTKPPEDLQVIYEITDEDLAEQEEPRKSAGRKLGRIFLTLIILGFLGMGALRWFRTVKEGKATLDPNSTTTLVKP